MATVSIKPEVKAGPAPHPAIPPEHLPNYDAPVTEDDQPVDNSLSERQMRLLADALCASWQRAGVLRVHELSPQRRYEPLAEPWLPAVGLGLTLWEGEYQGIAATWLRWRDENGNLLLTGAERAEQAEARIARLTAQLRAAGLEPANGDIS